jgi:Uma2 family endonuclease
MVQELEFTVKSPDISHLVTEDDTPVDNLGSERQQRLLSTTLYSSYPEETFLAAANVGIYYSISEPPVVPDVFLSLGVQFPEDCWEKKNRCYLMWEFGKPPEVALEIVSNKKGGELSTKLDIYQQMRVLYYIVYDPKQRLGESLLRVFELRGLRYIELEQPWLEQVNLGLTFWEGRFEGTQRTWLRWCDEGGNILKTGDERAQTAEEKANKLAEQLRALGVDPNTIS